jgi:peptidoglycan/LPS O-acetylase OafA/YrhL
MKPYFSGLDILRLFAATWVMNFHYLMQTPGELHWYRYGPFGVQLFFVISGFVILESISNRTVKEFATGRFIRLYPLFWILCTLTYLFTLVWPNADPVPFSGYLASMTIVGDWFSHRLVDPSYWSLSVEVLFYAAIACFVALFGVRRIRWFLVAWLAVSMLAFTLHQERMVLMRFLLVRHAAYFVFGATLSLVATGTGRTTRQNVFDGALMAISAAYATAIHPRAVQPFEVTQPMDSVIITWIHVGLFSIVLLGVYISRFVQGARVRRASAVIGGITYPLYLLHQTVGKNLIATFDRWAPFLVIALAVEALMFAACYGIFVVDKRLRAVLMEKLMGRPAKAQAVALRPSEALLPGAQ